MLRFHRTLEFDKEGTVLEVFASNVFGDYAFSGNHVGSWRIPELESKELPGQVSFDETGRITLELLGSFEPNP